MTSRYEAAREAAYPQLFRSMLKDKPALYLFVKVAHPPYKYYGYTMCPPIDRLGETGRNAAQSAAKHASENLPSELLKHVREDDYQALNIAISDGIREMLGVPGTGRRIRKALPYLSVGQAQMIAHSGMARAMHEATFNKILRLGYKLKQAITGPNPCPICQANRAQGPIPVDQPFSSGHQHGPFCLGCCCAISAARTPSSG